MGGRTDTPSPGPPLRTAVGPPAASRRSRSGGEGERPMRRLLRAKTGPVPWFILGTGRFQKQKLLSVGGAPVAVKKRK